MKKLHFVLMLSAVLLVAPSCEGLQPEDLKKYLEDMTGDENSTDQDGTGEDNPEIEVTRLLKECSIEYTSSGETAPLGKTSFIYDELKNLVTAEWDNFNENYEYSDGAVTLTSSGGHFNDYSKYMFQGKQLASIRGENDNICIEYIYNGNKPIKEVDVEDNSERRFSWDSKGNLTQVKFYDKNGAERSVQNFTYTDTDNMCNVQFYNYVFETWRPVWLHRSAFSCLINRHLPATYSDSGSAEMKFSYQFDEEGYPIEMKCELKNGESWGIDDGEYRIVLAYY